MTKLLGSRTVVAWVRRGVLVAVVLGVTCLCPLSARAVPVSLELALLVDVSGSIDDTEFALQKTGYVNAFNDPGIQALIAGTPNGIAVTLIYWSGASQQSQAVGWTHLTDAASATAFAAAINATVRPFDGLTAPGSAINFATPLFTNGFEGDRLVMDVSGDGVQNDGADTSDARDAALAAGITTINGIIILGASGLQTFYENNVIGGTNAFLLTANNFSDFSDGIRRKLEREIAGVPEPTTLTLLGVGALGLVGLLRRRGRKVA
jgi:hypothetical protein